MTDTYGTTLSELRREIIEGGARSNVIDQHLEKLVEYSDQNITLDLLLLLSDAAEHDEGMFSIIHAAESADDEEYVRALLAAFADMMRSAPRWASIVLMRALNSRSTQLELVKQLRGAPLRTKESVNEMCERINGVSPEFLSKTVPVTLAART